MEMTVSPRRDVMTALPHIDVDDHVYEAFVAQAKARRMTPEALLKTLVEQLALPGISSEVRETWEDIYLNEKSLMQRLAS
jgi:hypothetical protein